MTKNIAIDAPRGARDAAAKNACAPRATCSRASARYSPKATKKANAPIAKSEIGTPPQNVARKTAEYALKRAALQGLSPSLEAGSPGMKLQ